MSSMAPSLAQPPNSTHTVYILNYALCKVKLYNMINIDGIKPPCPQISTHQYGQLPPMEQLQRGLSSIEPNLLVIGQIPQLTLHECLTHSISTPSIIGKNHYLFMALHLQWTFHSLY